ncbi:hypothetical protein V496_05738 [Pseudogymnoascus sp. VKM F-4515 (FW-2607)]|nr:hypothetical protein V496_05738 [Pseudogymnoascus sp. VKM F-4515 (FW-2607)]KFY85463.1 hypothetical protein V498_07717 [Pseudogymnoascus sp. VKM F-4517 (FW-2822)]
MATQVSEIPTVAQLYQLKKLLPPGTESSASVTPSQALNNKVSIYRGNITKLQVDAIVNAANKFLAGGGGVDGAIHAAAGHGLLEECSTLDGCETGSAKITGAYELPCKRVIHAVGPVYSRSGPEKSAALLASCYTTSLQLAVDNDCKTIAFSGLSTGIYGYPSQDAASVATKAVRGFLGSPAGDKIDRVIFCTFEMKDVNAYNDWIPWAFPPTEQDLKGGDEGNESEQIETGDAAENPDAVEAKETTDDKEKVEGKDEAKKPEAVESKETADGDVSGYLSGPHATVDDLPEVPQAEPSVGDEPEPKRQKQQQPSDS